MTAAMWVVYFVTLAGVWLWCRGDGCDVCCDDPGCDCGGVR